MATSGKTSGKSLVFKLDTQGGVLKDISAYVESVDGLPIDIEAGEYACGGATGYSYIRGLPKGTIKLGCIFDDAADSAYDVVKSYKTDTATRSIEYGPAGSTGGFAKVTAEVCITKVVLPVKTTDSPVRFTVEMNVDGTDTITTW
jgi:hypothetical protein